MSERAASEAGMGAAMTNEAPAGRRAGIETKWLILAAVGLGSLVSGIDSSITNTVLPVIGEDFHASVTTIEWVLMAYLLVMSSLLLTMGRLGDLTGHRRVYLTGFGTFVAASMVCGAAPNELVLIAFRGVQACGAAMLSATGIVLITQAFGVRERGKGIGLLIAITYFGLAVGPALGGFLAGLFTWRAVFYVNVPVGLIGILLGLRILPKDTAVGGKPRFDLAGAALSAFILTCFLLALSQGQTWGWLSPATLACWALAVAGVAAFAPLELRHPEPMLDLRLFRARLFTTAVVSAMLFYAGTFFQFFLLPFYLVQARRFAVNTAGVLLIVTPVIMCVLAPRAGRLSDRIGSRVPSTLGMILASLGLVSLAYLGPHASITQIVLSEALMGVGSGMFSSPNTSTIMGSVSRERQGTAAGMQAVARNAGMVLGVALAGALLAIRLAALGGQSHFIPAYHDTLLIGGGIMLIGAALSSTRGRTAAGERQDRRQERLTSLRSG